MSLASPPGRLRCTGRRRRPIRIGSWAFTRTWVGEERWCPQQRPQGGKWRQKSASPLPVSLRQPRFPPDTDLLHQNTPEVDPARTKPTRGLGRDARKGEGQYPPSADPKALPNAARAAARSALAGAPAAIPDPRPTPPPPPGAEEEEGKAEAEATTAAPTPPPAGHGGGSRPQPAPPAARPNQIWIEPPPSPHQPSTTEEQPITPPAHPRAILHR